MSWEYCYDATKATKNKKTSNLVTVTYCSKFISCSKSRDTLFAKKEVSEIEPAYKKLPSLSQVMIKSKL